MQQGTHAQTSGGDTSVVAVETRLINIERKLEEIASSKKADAPAQLDKKGSGIWSDIVKTLIPSLVIAIVTFAIKDSVDMALKERQLQLENLQAMATLQTALQDPKIDPNKASVYAVQLAAFGRYSIPFFINVLEVGQQVATDNAEQGLRMVGRNEPEEVCTALTRVITNRTGLYVWTTHLRALTLLGQAGCGSSYADVSGYAQNLSSLAVLQKWVAPAPNPEQSEFDRLTRQAVATKALLETAPKPHWWRRL
jgi:hypothetical protein